MKQDYHLTEERYKEIEKKLERLKKSRPEAAAEVSRLAELGDFSENVEYQLAKGKLRGINSGILSLEHQLNQAEIITPQKQLDRVELGHTVTVLVDGKTKKYRILGSSETSPGRGVISHNSPLGAALVGREAGESVMVRLADKEVEYKILKIE